MTSHHAPDSPASSTEAPGLSTEKQQYLRALSIGHYVVAGLAFLIGCIPIIHVVIGVVMLTSHFNDHSVAAPEALLGCMFVGIGLLLVASAWVYAYFMVLAGRALNSRKRHLLCMVMAGISCMFAPFGTVVGIFSLIMLLDKAVQAEFGIEAS